MRLFAVLVLTLGCARTELSDYGVTIGADAPPDAGGLDASGSSPEPVEPTRPDPVPDSLRACAEYCDAHERDGCGLFASQEACVDYECSGRAFQTGPECQAAHWAYYDCLLRQPNVCDEAGCATERAQSLVHRCNF